VTTGTRGLAALEISLRTAAKDLHSGRYGGVAPNATHAMSRLLATLPEQGHIGLDLLHRANLHAALHAA